MSWPLKYESGIDYYDPSKALIGYTLITPMPSRFAPEPYLVPGEVLLIDMNGETVHSWKTPYPVYYSRLMPDGHIICCLRCSRPSPNRPGFDKYHMGGATGMLAELNWDSEAEFGLEGYVNGRIHFSPFISGADRLPNGNTMICSGANGVIFEITREKEVVWHWVRPTPNMDGAVHWGIFRAHRYPPDYCPQFQGLPPAKGC